MTSWKRRWLKSPVSSSVTAWRCTVSCRSTFSTETAAWLVRYENSSRSCGLKSRSPRATETIASTRSPPSVAESGAASADEPPRLISATSPASITAASAACSDAVVEARDRRVVATSSIGASARRRIVARPQSPPTPSTAVCTTISSTPTRSRPRANDSPTRRIASCRRLRSLRSSSSRPSSSRAIELNSLPRAANSSLPSAGTWTVKSPRPRRWAANSSRWTSADSVRLDDHGEHERERQERDRSSPTSEVRRVPVGLRRPSAAAR